VFWIPIAVGVGFAGCCFFSVAREKTDQDLSARRSEVLDLTLETMETVVAERQGFSAVMVNGPGPPWDTGGGSSLSTMQRLENEPSQ